jgi:alpha-mannosidase
MKLELMASGGNQWAFDDSFTDASLLLESGADWPPDSVTLVRTGPLLAGFEIIYNLDVPDVSVSVTQHIWLFDKVPYLLFDMDIDWQVNAGFSLWAAFPAELGSPKMVVADEVLGYRTFLDLEDLDLPDVPLPVASFLMHRWADYAGPQGGLALLSDSRYLFNALRGVLRLGLVRSCHQNMTPDYVWDQTHPFGDPPAYTDGGNHQLAFALYPHDGTWLDAGVHEKGLAFNHRLIPVVAERHAGELGTEAELLAVEPTTVLVSTVKKAEDTNHTILRLYNLLSGPVDATVRLPAQATGIDETDVLEWSFTPLELQGRVITLPLGSYEIRTMRMGLD